MATPPTTCYAGGQLSRRPFRWLAEEQSRLLNRRLCASATGPDHLLASGTKDPGQWDHSAELGAPPRQLLPFTVPIWPENVTILRVSLKTQRALRLGTPRNTTPHRSRRRAPPPCRAGGRRREGDPLLA